MQPGRWLFWIMIVVMVDLCVIATAENKELLSFRGCSDASTAVEIAEDIFVVADDENNTLRAYSINSPPEAVGTFDMTRFLGVDREHPEADIEGSARIGERI